MTDWEEDFSEYFRGSAARLRRMAYALCGDWHAAEDLVQATFVRLYRRWHRLHSETLDAYTYRVLVNLFLSGRRLAGREQVVAEPPDRAAAGGDPADRVDLARALAALPRQQRAIVVLRHLADLPVADVAELLGVAEGTVKSQTSRGVQTLRAALGARALPRG